MTNKRKFNCIESAQITFYLLLLGKNLHAVRPKKGHCEFMYSGIRNSKRWKKFIEIALTSQPVQFQFISRQMFLAESPARSWTFIANLNLCVLGYFLYPLFWYWYSISFPAKFFDWIFLTSFVGKCTNVGKFASSVECRSIGWKLWPSVFLPQLSFTSLLQGLLVAYFRRIVLPLFSRRLLRCLLYRCKFVRRIGPKIGSLQVKKEVLHKSE
jgi:hypothetical protein